METVATVRRVFVGRRGVAMEMMGKQAPGVEVVVVFEGGEVPRWVDEDGGRGRVGGGGRDF